MKCPVCGGRTKVVNSREKDNRKKRRRVCTECKYDYYTYEVLSIELDEGVSKNRSHAQPCPLCHYDTQCTERDRQLGRKISYECFYKE